MVVYLVLYVGTVRALADPRWSIMDDIADQVVPL